MGQNERQERRHEQRERGQGRASAAAYEEEDWGPMPVEYWRTMSSKSPQPSAGASTGSTPTTGQSQGPAKPSPGGPSGSSAPHITPGSFLSLQEFTPPDRPVYFAAGRAGPECNCTDPLHLHAVRWRTKKEVASAPGQRPLSAENKDHPARRRLDKQLRGMPMLYRVCMAPSLECAPNGHYHPKQGAWALEEHEVRELLQPADLDLDDGGELVPLPTAQPSNLSVVPQSSAQADDFKDPLEPSPAVQFKLGDEADFPKIEVKPLPPPVAVTMHEWDVAHEAQLAAIQKAKEEAEAAKAAALDPHVKFMQQTWAEERNEKLLHVECAPSAPPHEDPADAPQEEVKHVDDAAAPAPGPPAGGDEPPPGDEAPDLVRTTVLLYIRAGAYGKYAMSWKQWFLEKLPLLKATDDALYQRVRADMVSEIAEVHSVRERNFLLDVFGVWKSPSFGNFHSSTGLHWLLLCYDSVYTAPVYLQMYDALRQCDQWHTSMQLGPDGIRTTIHSFLYNLLKQAHPGRLAEWSKNEHVFNNTLNYCVNRYVVVHGTRSATATAARVDFRFEGALREASLNDLPFGGP